MPKIVIIDDELDEGNDFKNLINPNFELLGITGWRCHVATPFKTKDEYRDYIANDPEIAVLLLDVRFNNYTYDGEQLAEYLRGQNGDFPIYIMSSYAKDCTNPVVEAVMDRRDFRKDIKAWLPRMVRAGMRYVDTHIKELNELSILAQKIATSDATAADKEKLSAIQAKLQLPCPQIDTPHTELLLKLEKEIDKFDGLMSKLTKDGKK